MKKIIVMLFCLMALIGSASAALEYSDLKYSWGRYILGGGWSKVSLNLKNTGSVQEVGVIGIEHRTNPVYSIVSDQSSCDPRFPNDVQRSYKIDPGSSVSITLEAKKFDGGGTFYPYLVHVNHCCTNGVTSYACDAKQPFGWAYNLNNGDPIKFNKPDSTSNDQCDTDYGANQYLQKQGVYNCKTAVCQDPSSVNSKAVCNEYSCIEGAQQFQVCTGGDSIVIRTCTGSAWVETGNKCPSETLPDEPGTDEPLPVWVYVAGGVAVAGVGLLLLIKK